MFKSSARNAVKPILRVPLRQIAPEELGVVEHLIDVEMRYAEFEERFIPDHACHSRQGSCADPVECWYFELPWGQRIMLEYHLAIAQFSIHLGILEIESILEYLGLQECTYYIRNGVIALMKKSRPYCTEGLGVFGLYRQDDNGNQALMRCYESFRVADYYKRRYESLGHKQIYWVENEAPGR